MTAMGDRKIASSAVPSLLREPEGIACQVLTGFGLNAEELRTEIDRILRQPYSIAEATPFMRGRN